MTGGIYCRDCVFWVPYADTGDKYPPGRVCFRTWNTVTRRDAAKPRVCSGYRSHLEVCAELL
jgi:hypothetical protein